MIENSDDLPIMVPRMVRAPFTDDQVASLQGYHASGTFHPFTCIRGCRGGPLTATSEGWICRVCGYTQDWAHAWTADWTWRDLWGALTSGTDRTSE